MAQIDWFITTGKLFRTSILIDFAYSGNGDHLNNPQSTHIRMHGPLPVGNYTLKRTVDTRLGGSVFKLIPDPTNDMSGRDPLSFLIHYNHKTGGFTASDGCLIPLGGYLTFIKLLEGDTLTCHY